MADIFISRSVAQCTWLKQALSDHGHALTCESGISTQAVAFTLSQHVDWIFFSSSKGVQHFFEQAPPHIPTKWGAMGPGTAKTLAEYGTPSFIGEHTNPALVARAFKKEIQAHERVLFPVGKKSLRSIAQELSHPLIEEVVVYDTLFQPVKVDPHDLYIFSSPSNVQSFLAINPLPTTCTVMTFGPSTSKFIKACGYNVHIELTKATEKSILEAIISNFPS